jgi:hypothetical protein
MIDSRRGPSFSRDSGALRGEARKPAIAGAGSGNKGGNRGKVGSLITVASFVLLYHVNELPFHLNRALDNGVTRDALVELVTHLAFYSGWPTASSAVGILDRVLTEAEA